MTLFQQRLQGRFSLTYSLRERLFLSRDFKDTLSIEETLLSLRIIGVLSSLSLESFVCRSEYVYRVSLDWSEDRRSERKDFNKHTCITVWAALKMTCLVGFVRDQVFLGRERDTITKNMTIMYIGRTKRDDFFPRGDVFSQKMTNPRIFCRFIPFFKQKSRASATCFHPLRRKKFSDQHTKPSNKR